MKKDTHNISGVSKSSTNVAPIGDPRTSTQLQQPRRLDAAGTAAPPLSSRYIDSRLKQFCLR